MADIWDGVASPVNAPSSTDPWAGLASQYAEAPQQPSYFGRMGRIAGEDLGDIGMQLTRPFQPDNTAGPPLLQRIGDLGGRIGSIPTDLIQTAFSPAQAGIEAGANAAIPPIAQALQPLINDDRFKASNITPDKQEQLARDIGQVGTMPLMMPGELSESAMTPKAMIGADLPPILSDISSGRQPEAPAPVTTPVAAEPPLIDAMKTDAGNPLSVTDKGLSQAHDDLNTYLTTDGIDLNKTADSLEAAQKINPNVRAIDVMTQDQDGIPTGQNLMGLTKTIAQTPGEGRTLAGQMIARGATANDRIASAFDNSLSNADYYKTSDQLGQQMKDAGAAYDKAYRNPVAMDSQTINELLSRPAGQKALANAKTLAANEGATITTPDGKLNTQGIDYVKRALDDMVSNEGTSQFGTQTQEGKSFTGLKNGILSEADRINPDFALARANFATPAQQMEYLQMGRDFMKMDPEEISKVFADPSIPTANKTQFLTGARRELQDRLDTKGDTNAINTLWKPPLQKKVRAMMPDQQSYDSFAQYMDHEKNMARVNGKLVGGSDTLEKEEYNKKPATHLLSNGIRAVSGLPEFVGGKIADFIDSKLADQAKSMSQESKTAIARYLTTKDPDLLRKLDKQINPPAPPTLSQRLAAIPRSTPAAARIATPVAVPANPTAIQQANGMIPQQPTASVQPPIQATPQAQKQPNPLIQRIAQAESGGNPAAQNPNSTASGPLQFTNKTWADSVARWGKQLGITLADKSNPQAQMIMGQRLAQDNARIMASKLGRPPTDGEIYAAHVFGAHDVVKLINAAQATPDRAAVTLYPRKVVDANRNIFWSGTQQRSASQVYQLMNGKIA